MKTTALRLRVRAVADVLARPFVFLHIPPNAISVSALLTLVAFFPLLRYDYYVFAALMIALNGILDLMDGAVARLSGKSCSFGKFLDRTIDKISDAAILASFIIFGLVNLPLGVYTLVAVFLATNISANIEAVLKFQLSDAVSMRFLRIFILILFTALRLFDIMFIILAAIATYSLIYRFVAACYLYFRK